MTSVPTQPRNQLDSLQVLVYGSERFGITPPEEPIRVGPITLIFEPYGTSRRFDEFHGVITFQGIFETFKRVTNVISPHMKHDYDRNALDKRKKEAALLTDKGGFICFLLIVPFIDRNNGESITTTDLAKYHLSYSNFYRENFNGRVTQIRAIRDEFRGFLQAYGAAWSHFHHYNDQIEWKVIAKVANNVCGMVINQSDYFVPSLVPDNEPEVVVDFFSKLATAIQLTRAKLDNTVPDWVSKFEFDEESALAANRADLQSQIDSIDEQRGRLTSYKGILAWSGERLVDGVGNVFRSGFGFGVDLEDQLREDLRLVNENGEPWCLVEVKGVNRGVNRESINQADSHRERSGLPHDFPTVLIMNIGMKSKRNLATRDIPVSEEQVIHARAMNVLVMRTLDLLWLLRLHKSGRIDTNRVKSIFASHKGWLRVSEEGESLV